MTLVKRLIFLGLLSAAAYGGFILHHVLPPCDNQIPAPTHLSQSLQATLHDWWQNGFEYLQSLRHLP